VPVGSCCLYVVKLLICVSLFDTACTTLLEGSLMSLSLTRCFGLAIVVYESTNPKKTCIRRMASTPANNVPQLRRVGV